MKTFFRNTIPLLLLILLNVIGILLMYVKGIDALEDMTVLCVIMCAVNIIIYSIIKIFSLGDSYLFIIVSMLSSVGIIMQSRINQDNGIRQMKLYLIGVVLYFIALFVYKYLNKYLNKLTIVYWGVSIALFLVTIKFGAEINGAKSWFIISGISIQPSEFIKILFVLSMAAVLTKGRNRKKGKYIPYLERKKIKNTRLLFVAAVAFSNTACLALQRDWGTALLFFATYIALLYIYGENKWFFAANILAIIAGISALIYLMDKVDALHHIQTRVNVWLDLFSASEKDRFQLERSLYALSAGGFAGSGIGAGSPYLIPVVSSDFIFVAICEEMGVLGGVSVLMIYFLLVYRGFKIALSSTNEFNKSVAAGFSIMLGIQTFIIIGGVTKLIPLTGITLPFISFGGSSMMSTFLVMGILQAISSIKGEVTDEIE